TSAIQSPPVHLWVSYDGFEGGNIYSEIAVRPGDTPASLSERWRNFLREDLKRRAVAEPHRAAAVNSVLQRIDAGELPVIGAAYRGSASSMSQVLANPPARAVSVADGVGPDGRSPAAPDFPLDAASLAA